MKVEPTTLPGVIQLTPERFTDFRGYFMECFRLSHFQEAIGAKANFAQENQSLSLKKNTIRGLHFQAPPHAQGKLVRCLKGRILDVAVDVRQGSPHYGKSIAVDLSAKNDRQLWIPAGFLHGFRTLEDNTIVNYKCTTTYAPGYEGAILWNDPELAIDWGTGLPGAISERDSEAGRFGDFVSPFHFEPAK